MNKRILALLSLLVAVSSRTLATEYALGFSEGPSNASSSHIFVRDGSGEITTFPFLGKVQTSGSIAWSQDGQLLAFAQTSDSDIYTINVITGVKSNATNNPAADSSPSFSPDGANIVFTSLREDDGYFDLFTTNLLTGDTRNITNHPSADVLPRWSPTDNSILFTSLRDGDNEGVVRSSIYSVSPEGEHLTLLSEPGEDAGQATWSPDGKRIAFYSRKNGNRDIIISDLNGENRVQVTSHDADDDAPSWSPDGTTIAFVSKRNGSAGSIYFASLEGNEPQRITNPAGGLRHRTPAFRPVLGPLAVDAVDKLATSWATLKMPQ